MKKYLFIALAAMSLSMVSCKNDSANGDGEKKASKLDKLKEMGSKAADAVKSKVNIDKITSDPMGAVNRVKDAATSAIKNKDVSKLGDVASSYMK